MKEKIKTWGKLILLVIFLLLTFSYAMFQGGFVSWFLFYSFIPFALYALCVALYPLGDMKVERVFNRDTYTAGEHLEMTITIERKFSFPLFFLIIKNTSSLSTENGKQIIFPGFKKHIRLEYSMPNVPRGEHHFDKIYIKIGDPIGLFEKEKSFSLEKTILVYPAYTDIIYRSIESRYEQGATASQIKIQNDTTMVTGIRNYEPGDRFTWIDWKATARMNEMQTKEFEERQSNDLTIILDRSPSSSFEASVKFAASLIRTVIRHGGQIGFYSIGGDQSIFPIRGGDEYQQQLFHHLAKVKADSRVSMSTILDGEIAFYQQAASLIIITSNLSKSLIQTLRKHGRRTGTVIIFVVKITNEAFQNEEYHLSTEASRYGLFVHFLHEEDFRSALTGVKHR
ncbi:DUF58 domain-containing protein [Heyndrickxia sp. NPDC080065]|uniref:DUF58 domain-containing protein n=1 Tax=Heyndrickxia sp. NPDC080065 TaxID=3390568 RepID=UPI003CFCE740